MLTLTQMNAKHSETPKCPHSRGHHWVAVLATGALLACSSILPQSAVAQDSATRTSLWKISSSNTTAYLQGSIHLLSDSSYPLPRQIDDAFLASEQIVLEMDLSVMTNSDAQIKMMIQGMLPRGESLTDIISPKTQKLAAQCAADVGLHMAMFKHYKPWMFVMTLTATKLQKLGFSPEHGLDFHFFKRAGASGKSVTGLETLDEQLAFFDAMVQDDQDAFVRQSLEDFALIEAELTAIIKAWRQGDLDSLSEVLLKHSDKYPDLHNVLIRDRNLKWMPPFNEVMRSGVTTMFIVGAGHIPGEDGLLSLLQAQGYTIEQQ